jgi:hypothetical protein
MVHGNVYSATEPSYSCDRRAQPRDNDLCEVCQKIDFEEVHGHLTHVGSVEYIFIYGILPVRTALAARFFAITALRTRASVSIMPIVSANVG